eukprot:1104472-Pyramimonas_sp.AAC.2
MGVCASEPHYVVNRMRDVKRGPGTATTSAFVSVSFFEASLHVIEVAWIGETGAVGIRVFALEPTNALTAMIGYHEDTPVILSLAFIPQQTPSGLTIEGHHLLAMLHADEGDDGIRTVNLSCVSVDLTDATVHTGPWAVRYASIHGNAARYLSPVRCLNSWLYS